MSNGFVKVRGIRIKTSGSKNKSKNQQHIADVEHEGCYIFFYYLYFFMLTHFMLLFVHLLLHFNILFYMYFRLIDAKNINIIQTLKNRY